MLESWCTWHLAIGFTTLFLYFDDPTELDSIAADLCKRHPQVNKLCLGWPHRARSTADLALASSR